MAKYSYYDHEGLLDDRTHWWRLLSAPPWRRAPLLLRRQPGVLLALAVGAAILGIAGASAPLFLASASSAELASVVADNCPEDSAVVVTGAPGALDTVDPTDRIPVDTAGQDRTARAALRDAGLPAPYQVVLAAAQLAPAGSSPFQAVLYARADVAEHLPVARRAAGDGGDGRGVWLPVAAARSMRVAAGDTVEVNGTSVPVAGTYRPFDVGGVLPRYWCSWSSLVQPSSAADASALFVPVDLATIQRVRAHRVGQWFSPVAGPDLTVRSGRDVLRRAARLPVTLQQNAHGPDAFALAPQTNLNADLDRAELASHGLRGPILPVAVAGTLVALVLVAASGGYWAERRSAEVRLLASRGVPPAAIGVKAVVESAPAVLVGLAAGWVAGIGLVRWLGPSAVLEDGAGARALATVGAVGALGLVLLGTVTGLRARAAVSRRRRRLRGRAWRRIRVWRVLPWELALLGVAALLYRQARAEGVRLDHFLVQVPPKLVVFPLVGLAGALLCCARIAARLMPALRRATGRTPAAAFLASRRITAAPAVFLALLVATALPVALFCYASTLSHSTGLAVQRKAAVNLGAERVLVTDVDPTDPAPDAAGHGTPVEVVTGASLAADTQAQVLGVDPATFGRYALDVADRPLGDLLALLAGDAGADPPAILVNPTDSLPVHDVFLSGVTVPVRVVATVRVFPGLRSAVHPMLVVPRAALHRVGAYTRVQQEVWTDRAELVAARAALRAGQVAVTRVRAPDDVLAATDLVTVTWALDFLRALALLVGVIVAAGLLLYLAARQRARLVSYVVGRRLGLRRRTHLAALLVEVGAAVGLGWLLGLAGGLGSVGMVVPILDVNAQYPPPTAMAVPAGGVVGAAVVLAGLTVLCALTTQYTADRTPPATITRLGA